MDSVSFFTLFIAMCIENACQLFLYSKLTTKKIPFRMMVILPVISIVVYLFFNYWIFLVIIIYFLIIGKKLHGDYSTNLIWFFGIYTTFSYVVFAYFMNSSILFLIGEDVFDQYMYLINMIVSPIFSIVCNLILLRLIRPSVSFLEKYQDNWNQIFLLIINILLTLCCIIQFGNYWIERYLLKDENPIRKYLIVVFILVIILLIIYLNIKTRQLDKQRIQRLKDSQLADLTSYVQQIETMYEELRGFRHDYHNVLISLNESIKTKDLTVIEDTYKRVLTTEGIVLDDEHFALAKLNNLKTLPIKGIFSTHIIQAFQKNISVHLEIDDIIQEEPIEILDYVRVVSILLDNAIEAAEKAASPFMTIVFLKNEENREIQLTIENSCSDESIDIVKIFNKDYSTKGKNRGFGLATVQSILQNYTNLSLQTEYQDGIFRQILMIKEDLPR
ncbi:two-component system, LytTR family, sensor histidine kinase AgrC [Enterococcus sp. AZ007]|uniref:GHKL domain-containing protein n=1 Tax=Candidatus Enterococcus murrayae TaxID=2815321 RepID=A0ABS3HL87_9ENTE|nr:GHKL domain-containing protein [Enterococcus sp. MJM16]